MSSSASLPLTRWPSSRSSFLRGRSNVHGGCRHPAGDVEWAVGFAFHLKDFTDAHTPSSRRGGCPTGGVGWGGGVIRRQKNSFSLQAVRPSSGLVSALLPHLSHPLSALPAHPPLPPTSPNPTSVSHQCTKHAHTHTHAQ